MADPQTILTQPTAICVFQAGREVLHGRVLDVGCGSKPYAWMFECEEYVGLDIRPVGEIHADAHDMPIPDESFDSVLCAETLHQCFSPLTVMREIARVLKPGGTALITAPSCYPEDETSFWGIRARALELLCRQAGLEVETLAVDGQLWSMEFNDHKSLTKYGVPVYPELDGWLAEMNQRYPSLTWAVATKPKE